MKRWRVEHRIRYIDGKTETRLGTVQARNITQAIGAALLTLRKPMIDRPDVTSDDIVKVEVIE